MFNSSSFQGGQNPAQGQEATAIGAFLQGAQADAVGPFVRFFHTTNDKWQRGMIQSMLEQGKSEDQVIEEVIRMGAAQREGVKGKVAEGMAETGFMVVGMGQGAVLKDAAKESLLGATSKFLGRTGGHLAADIGGDFAQHYAFNRATSLLLGEGGAEEGGGEPGANYASMLGGAGASNVEQASTATQKTADGATKATAAISGLVPQLFKLADVGGKADKGTKKTTDALGSLFGIGGSLLNIFAPGSGTILSMFGGLFGSFDSGGYTGAGATNTAAGIVHRGEYVVDRQNVNRLGGPNSVRALLQGGGAAIFAQSDNRELIKAVNGLRQDVQQQKLVVDQYGMRTAVKTSDYSLEAHTG
jgi:hypothetical protein